MYDDGLLCNSRLKIVSSCRRSTDRLTAKGLFRLANLANMHLVAPQLMESINYASQSGTIDDQSARDVLIDGL